MENLTRREILGTALTAGAGLLFTENTVLAAKPEADLTGSFAGKHQPKPLPYPFGKLKGLSESLVKSHWENNYSGAVKALNTVESKLGALIADKGFPPYLYADYKREQLARTGSVVLHEFYFANLGGDGKAGGEVHAALGQAFGAFGTWESEFRKIANGLSGGSGWVVLAYDLHLGQLANYWAPDHLHGLPSALPLLVLDMYEHAYHLDYGAAAAKYLDAFFANISWEEVNRRFQSAKKAAAALRA